jgi:hypothetical protein
LIDGPRTSFVSDNRGMKPLDGAKLKVVRAKEHLDSLKVEIGAYLDTKPYDFLVNERGDELLVGEAVVKVSPPLKLGCIFGDCLTNLRAGLDYVAWELAAKNSATPPVVGVDKIYFPFHKTAASFSSNGRAKLENIPLPAEAIDIIESVQPYHSGNESLALLSHLGNQDKHCLPLLTIAYAKTARLWVLAAGKKFDKIVVRSADGRHLGTVSNSSGVYLEEITEADFAEDCRPPGPIRWKTLGMIIPHPDTTRPRPPGEPPRSVEVDGQATVFVSVQDALMPLEPVDLTLEKIVKCVTDIVPRFERFV